MGCTRGCGGGYVLQQNKPSVKKNKFNVGDVVYETISNGIIKGNIARYKYAATTVTKVLSPQNGEEYQYELDGFNIMPENCLVSESVAKRQVKVSPIIYSIG